jgi:hypothetical protein
MTILVQLLSFVRGLAKELSDEAAYQRHLSRAALPHSAKEWRKFSDARFRRKYRQGKCC